MDRDNRWMNKAKGLMNQKLFLCSLLTCALFVMESASSKMTILNGGQGLPL